MNPQTLAAATGCTTLRAGLFAQAITDAMKRWGIDTPLRQAAFLGQISEETGGLTVLSENLNYSAKRLMEVWPSRFPTAAAAAPFAMNPQALAERAYGGRMGNTQPGEGYKYRGRGLIQLTGKTAYTDYAMHADADALVNPDILLDPHYAADSAGWFWSKTGCNAFADAKDWHGLTKRINGNPNANFDMRLECITRAMTALGAV